MKSLKDKMFKNFSKEEVSNYGSIIGGANTYTTSEAYDTYCDFEMKTTTDYTTKQDEGTRGSGGGRREGDADKNGSQFESAVGHF